MVYLHTCRTCLKGAAECAVRDALKIEARRLGVTSMRHRCKEATPLFQPGDPVTVKTIPTYDRCGEEEYQIPRHWFQGHFVRWAGNRPVVHVKAGTLAMDDDDWKFEPSANGYIKASLARVKASSGERADVKQCHQCGAVPGLGESCQRDPNYFRDTHCQALSQASGEAA